MSKQIGKRGKGNFSKPGQKDLDESDFSGNEETGNDQKQVKKNLNGTQADGPTKAKPHNPARDFNRGNEVEDSDGEVGSENEDGPDPDPTKLKNKGKQGIYVPPKENKPVTGGKPSNNTVQEDGSKGSTQAGASTQAPKLNQTVRNLADRPGDYAMEKEDLNKERTTVSNLLKKKFDASKSDLLKPGSPESAAVEDAARKALKEGGTPAGEGFTIAAYVEGVTMALMAPASKGAPPAIVVLNINDKRKAKPKLTRKNNLDEEAIDAILDVNPEYWSVKPATIDKEWQTKLNGPDAADFKDLLAEKKEPGSAIGHMMKDLPQSAITKEFFRSWQAYNILAARALAPPGAVQA